MGILDIASSAFGLALACVLILLLYIYWQTYGRYNVKLGGLDMARWCRGKGADDAWIRENKWYCKYPAKDVYSTPYLVQPEYNNACISQYANTNARGFNTLGSAKNWTCYSSQ